MITEAAKPVQKEGVNSFLGLSAYTEEQSKMFFGRDEEIKSLYKLIKSHTLTIVFGKSGTGKTSLLNAGVFPKLREDYCLPFRIRLEFFEDSADLLTQIKTVLKSEIDKYGFKVESYPTKEETLWEYFHRESLWEMVTPILIFDQFEEIFTLASKSTRFKKEELDIFLEEISDVVENSIPERIKEKIINDAERSRFNHQKQKCKVIFSFREDFLPEIESITAKIPSVKNSRFRLRAMNGQQAFEVITKTWNNSIDRAEAKKIVYFLTNETETESTEVESKYGKYETIEIEPSLLSQVCSYLDKEKQHEGLAKISASFLDKYPKGILLRSLYNQVLQEAALVVSSSIKSKELKRGNVVQEFIEDNLITDEGYRTKFSINEVAQPLRPGIEVLKRKYFIREEGTTIELTHDVIVTLVKSDREERRKKAALLIARQKAKRRSRLILVAASVLGLIVLSLTVYAWNQRNALQEEQKDLAHDIEEKRVDLKEKNDSLLAKIDSLENLREQISTVINAKNLKIRDTLPVEVPQIENVVQNDTRIAELENEINELKQTNSEIDKTVSKYKNDLDQQKKEYEERQKRLAQEVQNKSLEITRLGKDKQAIELAIREKEQHLSINMNILLNEKQKMQSLLDRFLLKHYIAKPGEKIFGYGHDYALQKDKKQK